LQARGVALADCPELPLAEAAVDLAEDHRGLGCSVLGQVVTCDLAVVGLVDNPDKRVAHLAEILLALLGLVDAHREHDLAGLSGHGGQVDLDLLIVTLAAAGQVVAHVLDRTIRALQVVEEHEVAVGEDPAVHVEHDRGGVQVKVRPGGRARIPAEPDYDRGEAGRLLGERDVATLGETDTHCCSLLRTKTVRMCSVTLSYWRPRASATLYGPVSTRDGRSVLGVCALIQQPWSFIQGSME